MPHYADPKMARAVKDAISPFSNQAKVAILGFLSENHSATRGEIAKAIGVAVPTVQNNLKSLTEAGALVADPPASEERNGQRVRYSLNQSEIRRSYDVLGAAIGVIERPDSGGETLAP